MNFSFTSVSLKDVNSLLRKLDPSKACQKENVPTSILKGNSDIFSDIISKDINTCIRDSSFPDDLKIAEVVPCFKKDPKKDSKNKKDNYRPISILPNISKIHERALYDQIAKYFDNIFSQYQFGFREGISAQQCLIRLVEFWKASIDNKKAFGALLTDLSKAFDCVNHELLIAKLDAYGVDYPSLKLIYSYLKNRKQRVRINNSYSPFEEIEHGVPQGSILGPLFFNINICDLFYFIEEWETANYADDTTPYTAQADLDTVIKSLESCAKILFSWFESNFMKANSDKSHLLLSSEYEVSANINNNIIKNSQSEKLLGVIIDTKLNFEEHTTRLCNKASQKLSALARISSYMSIQQRRRIMKAFISSQFGYCPLVWLFCSRNANNRMNRIQERALRIVYNDKVSSFSALLERDNSVTIHSRNLQVLATEIFKVKNNLASPVMNEIFGLSETPYNLRKSAIFQSRRIRTQSYGLNSLAYLGPKIWQLVPEEIKRSVSLNDFKSKIKTWKTDRCPCKLCKRYVPNLGYI